jgi:hypothetical protein
MEREKSIVWVLGLFMLLFTGSALRTQDATTPISGVSGAQQISSSGAQQVSSQLNGADSTLNASADEIRQCLEEIEKDTRDLDKLHDQLDSQKKPGDQSGQDALRAMQMACDNIASSLQYLCDRIRLLIGKVPGQESALKAICDLAKSKGVLTVQNEKTVEIVLNRIHVSVADANKAISAATLSLFKYRSHRIHRIPSP